MLNRSWPALALVVVTLCALSRSEASETVPPSSAPDAMEYRNTTEVRFAHETASLIREGIRDRDALSLFSAVHRMTQIQDRFAVQGLFDGGQSEMSVTTAPIIRIARKQGSADVLQARQLVEMAARFMKEDQSLSEHLKTAAEKAKRYDSGDSGQSQKNKTVRQACLWGNCCGRYGCWSWCSWW